MCVNINRYYHCGINEQYSISKVGPEYYRQVRIKETCLWRIGLFFPLPVKSMLNLMDIYEKSEVIRQANLGPSDGSVVKTKKEGECKESQ